REAIGYGESVNEARENAIAALGADIEFEVQFEILETPKKKVLGLFGGSQAKVRAYIELPDPKPAKEKKNQKKSEKPAKAEKKSVPEKKEAPKKEKKAEPQKSSVEEDFKDAVDASEIPADTKAGKAINYIKTVLVGLGIENVSIKAAVKDDGAFIVLDGEGLGAVIGHRGETLDALQYLSNLAANNGGGYYKISVNIGDYRQKREQTLTSLAKRISGQVIRTGRSRRLEPMNPYERRIIHTAVQEIKGVTSASIGEGSGRRVVISPEGGEAPRSRGGRNDRGRKPSSTVATAPTREPKKDSDIPLYGKIN
ncbi:MAG: Jag N-terminal domain-containing protein, partial [Clostridia bacterium]|nr:Jag N-terminal domain-containing protein [Clostridia bacterium]